MASRRKNKRHYTEDDDLFEEATETKKMSLKLILDGRSKKVIFAEAEKDVIDFLFGLLLIPVGAIMTILTENGLQLGSLSRVQRSISEMGARHFNSGHLKCAILKPTVCFGREAYNPPSRLKDLAYFDSCCIDYKLNYPDKVEGYVKADSGAYMVMDDLVVCPLSTTSVFAALKKYKIMDLSLLEENNVKIDLEKCAALIKASMESDEVLTDVFTSHLEEAQAETSGTK